MRRGEGYAFMDDPYPSMATVGHVLGQQILVTFRPGRKRWEASAMNNPDSPLTTLGRLPPPLGLSGPLSSPLRIGLASRPPQPMGLASTLLAAPNLLSQNGSPLSSATQPPPQPVQPMLEEPDGARSVVARFTHTPMDMTLPLFDSSGSPKLDDVVQGFLGSCPVAAILMAKTLCHPDDVKAMLIVVPTTQMRSRVRSTGTILTSTRGFIVVFTRNVSQTTAQHPGHAAIISSQVYANVPTFSVGIKSLGPNAHEVLYLRSTSSGDPNLGVAWPSFIEKGYAVLKGGYNALDHPDTLEVMFDFCGNFDLLRFSTTPFSAILSNIIDNTGAPGLSRSFTDQPQLDAQFASIFSRCKLRPTIACTPDHISDTARFFAQHCYAVSDFIPSTSSVILRNPLIRTTGGTNTRPQYTVPLADFKNNFAFVLQATT